MNNKSSDKIILLPGSEYWETWISNGAEFRLHENHGTAQIAELPQPPSGDVLLCFPVQSITCLPFITHTQDASLFDDLARNHAEGLGIRTDSSAGQLSDVFKISEVDEISALLTVILKTPSENELPPYSPQRFDISSRAFPVQENAVVIWKELGRWVFAMWQKGKMVYSQSTTSQATFPDKNVAQDINISILSLAQLHFALQIDYIIFWTNQDPSFDQSHFQRTFPHASLQTLARPAPIVPDPISKLLPQNVQVARRAATLRRRQILAAILIGLTIIGLLAYGIYDLWKIQDNISKINAKTKNVSPFIQQYETHSAKWAELSDAIDVKNSPIDLLSKIALSIPPNSGLRIKDADITARDIKLTGEGQNFDQTKAFEQKISTNPELQQFKWTITQPSKNQTGWTFRYDGSIDTSSKN